VEKGAVSGFGQVAIVPENLPQFFSADLRKTASYGLGVGVGVVTLVAVVALLCRATSLNQRAIIALSGVAAGATGMGAALASQPVKQAILDSLPQKVLQANTQGELGVQQEVDLLVLNKVDDSFELKLKIASCATRSIEWSLCYASGGSLTRALDIIEQRLSECHDLKVHIMLSSRTLCASQRSRLDQIKSKFPGRFFYLETKAIRNTSHQFARNEEIHVKALIVDGRYFVIGGSNMQPCSTRESLPEKDRSNGDTLIEMAMAPSFRDTDVAGRGESMARTIRGQFFNLYTLWAMRQEAVLQPNEGLFFDLGEAKAGCSDIDDHPRLRKGARAALFVSGPEHAGSSPIEAEYIRQLNKAKKSSYMGSLYCRLTPGLKKALSDAKDRSVEVTAIVPKTSGFELGNMLAEALSPDYRHFSCVWGYQVPNCTYHSKKAIFDSSAAIVGSFNLSWKSAYCDAEMALSIESEQVVSDLMEGFQEDIQRSTSVHLTQPPLFVRAIGEVITWFSRLDGITTG
jgi:PLD-like domain